MDKSVESALEDEEDLDLTQQKIADMQKIEDQGNMI